MRLLLGESWWIVAFLGWMLDDEAEGWCYLLGVFVR